MPIVLINGREFSAEKGKILCDVLIKNGFETAHPCGRTGKCKKCEVTVDGKTELSCRYIIEKDITVETAVCSCVHSANGASSSEKHTENTCLVLDLGTTTLALASVSKDEKKALKIITATNPQTVFGADVISRLEFAEKNGTELMQKAVTSKINEMTDKANVKNADLYVSGNTAMLHILLGINPSSMGKAPYTPVFLKSQTVSGEKIGLKNIKNVITLPCVSAFVGADLVAGLNKIAPPQKGKYNLLVDIGTNAEIILQCEEKILCTSAAAGPCFEGASISQGMNASDGAICEYTFDGKAKTVGNKKAIGICGTGLIDIISVLLQKEIIDETGLMDTEKYEITPYVFITQGDIRQYQNAKSAIYSGILTLMNAGKVKFHDIEKLYISGGFSSKINVENAALTGLLPRELLSKCKNIGNSSLEGAIKFAVENNDLSVFTAKSEYIDLAKQPLFSKLFIENMMFN